MKISKAERNKLIMEFLPKINYIVKSLKQENLPPIVTEAVSYTHLTLPTKA